MRLPLSDAREMATESRVNGAPTVGASRRIVLVEDNDDLRDLFRILLEHRGHYVKEARDGIEGLSHIPAEKPDLAIVDIGLRGMDGYEVARQVRSALGHTVLLVAMTGYVQESDRLEALAAGFDTHVTKPFDIGIVERLLDTQ